MLALLLFLLPFQQSAAVPTSAPEPSRVVRGKGAPTVAIPRLETEEEVAIDGSLSESVWSQAVCLTGFSQYDPVDGRPAEEETEVLVWYSPAYIYFGIIAHDSQPDTVRATVADRDNLDSDDTVMIYLDTFDDSRRAFVFGVNPLGIQTDGVQTEGGGNAGSYHEGGGMDKSPDYKWDSKGKLTEDGYTVEIRIPFKSLRYPGSGSQHWGINFKRTIQRTGYQDTWTDALKGRSSFLAQSGAIEGLHDLERGVVLEAQPFITATKNGARNSETGDFEREKVKMSPGVNMRIAFTNLSLDATVNPDFSQVESDAGQVTANERFALYYPEKRPFFLEGIELFSTPNQLVYTRQIVDPIAGGKLTGKFGRFGVAYLNAVDETSDGNAVFNVTRIRRDFGANSMAGFTYTDRTLTGDSNRVAAGDVRWVFGKLYFVQGQLGRSWTALENIKTSSPIWNVTFDRTGRSFGFNYELNGIGESFDARSGYVPRNNIVDGHAMNRVSYFGDRGDLLESIRSTLRISRIWEYGGFMSDPSIEGADGVNADFQLRGGWHLSADFERDFTRFDPNMYEGFQVLRPDGTIEDFQVPGLLDGLWNGSFGVNTPTYRSFNAGIDIQYGMTPIYPEASEGRETQLDLSLNLRPTDMIRVETTLTTSFLKRARDGSEFARTIIPRVKIEYQPKRSIFFRVVGEYRSERQVPLEDPATGDPLLVDNALFDPDRFNGLRLDLLFSYEPTPGTVAFVGYGSSLEAENTFGIRDLMRTSDGFFVKLAYRFIH